MRYDRSGGRCCQDRCFDSDSGDRLPDILGGGYRDTGPSRLDETPATVFGQSGPSLTVDYTATVDRGVGAGASLVNTATVGYSSAPNTNGHVTPGTNNVADDNTEAASIQLDGLKVGKAGPASPLRIGDVGSYDITFTVPAYDVAYSPTITDTINRQGFKYIGNATRSRASRVLQQLPPRSPPRQRPVQSYPTGSSTAFTWNLSNPIDNSTGATPATFRLRFALQYTALAQNGTTWEFAPPAAATTASDTAQPQLERDANRLAEERYLVAVNTDMGQPVLAVTKAFNPLPSPLPVGGSTINYRVTIRNNGSQPAYNVSLDDTLPVEAVSSAMTGATLSGTGFITSQITTSFTSGPPPAMRFVLAPAIQPSEVATIDYTVTLSSTVAAGAALKNIADADWDSLPELLRVTGIQRLTSGDLHRRPGEHHGQRSRDDDTQEGTARALHDRRRAHLLDRMHGTAQHSGVLSVAG